MTVKNYRVRCPIITACDLCLLSGLIENVAKVRRIHAKCRRVARKLAKGIDIEIPEYDLGTWCDVCRHHDREYVSYSA